MLNNLKKAIAIYRGSTEDLESQILARQDGIYLTRCGNGERR